MNFLLDLLQGAGIALAIGIRPFLPVLLVGLLAAANLGVDFDGTSFAFLENPVLIGLMVAATVALYLGRDALERSQPQLALGAVGLVLAALEASGCLDDRSATWWPGIPVGLACAAFAFVVSRALLSRVRGRLDDEAAGALPFYAEAAALVVAGASVLFPPLALVALGLLVRLQLGGKRREGEKYAGLRILR